MQKRRIIDFPLFPLKNYISRNTLFLTEVLIKYGEEII